MDVTSRIERALNEAIGQAELPGCPPRLAAAMRYAVFPRGARVRPRLCHSVAAACGEDHPAATNAAGAALELLHCASLVHDDLPCFDAAETRRGRPSVHKAFGEPLAVLTGDALIVLAFQTLARLQCTPERLAALTLTVARSVGVPVGIVAGQAWECEDEIDLAHYHRAKTGALFAAATVAGAASAGADCEPWRMVGEKLGEAYQVADDSRDAASDEDEIGKPVGRDLALGRPSAVIELGLDGALYR
ncbi:MAG: polyprenyl synthetase family protein, partial [Bradyrhizobium sp.]|uniref:polyprenyl synthetase family protein n=1 Tax=Bradyrhizobium sp. TaxID=376 RepID=UPI00391AD7DE